MGWPKKPSGVVTGAWAAAGTALASSRPRRGRRRAVVSMAGSSAGADGLSSRPAGFPSRHESVKSLHTNNLMRFATARRGLRARPNLLFVHIGEPDYAGHRFSWMSTFYGS